jgi:hypothetical protein
MEREVKDKVTSQPGYQNAYVAYDIHAIWNMTEQVCVECGAISVYALITKLPRTTEREGYQRYSKEFKEAVADLRRQGGVRQPLASGQQPHPDTIILEMIFNAIFILGLNPEQFKEKLTTIYGQQNWPAYDILSQELKTYAEATEQMEMLTTGKAIMMGSLRRTWEARILPWDAGTVEVRIT